MVVGKLVAKGAADRAARQRQNDTRREIEPDQDADIGEANAKGLLKQRRDRGHALELECDGEANHEQDRKNAPAIAQRLILQPS
ncbi:hypothetical protein [Bradyrhizobium neotropicale]|uniref:hypothetical protein n=1 Tax=Bradyrhizobium neotropicale TaxID=1497615 RepID=UPI000A8AACB4|nr:hypothetical protein [Bradyrhizobium neotropicale]